MTAAVRSTRTPPVNSRNSRSFFSSAALSNGCAPWCRPTTTGLCFFGRAFEARTGPGRMGRAGRSFWASRKARAAV